MKRLGFVKPVVTVAGIFMLSGVAMAQMAQERGYEWGWGMHPMMGGFWGVWGIGMMFFWGLAIAGAVLGIRWLITQRKQ